MYLNSCFHFVLSDAGSFNGSSSRRTMFSKQRTRTSRACKYKLTDSRTSVELDPNKDAQCSALVEYPCPGSSSISCFGSGSFRGDPWEIWRDPLGHLGSSGEPLGGFWGVPGFRSVVPGNACGVTGGIPGHLGWRWVPRRFLRVLCCPWEVPGSSRGILQPFCDVYFWFPSCSSWVSGGQ